MPTFKTIFVRPPLMAAVMLAAALLLTGCAAGNSNSISKFELFHQIQSDSPPTIVDVRSSMEYEAGHIPGAINIPWWSVLSRHCNVPSAHEEPLIIYCKHGTRAKLAKLGLNMFGFQEIFYLEGHMPSWEQENLPVEKGSP